jgi:molybdopterin converting factor subunit 1
MESDSILVRVLLFARARETAGADTVELRLPISATVAELRSRLAIQIPALASLLAGSAIAVNREFAEDSIALRENDEIALIPPVSGG